VRERESVSSSLSLSASSSPSSFSSLIPTSPLPPHLVDVLLRRVRAQHGVEGELDFFFFFRWFERKRERRGYGKRGSNASALLAHSIDLSFHHHLPLLFPDRMPHLVESRTVSAVHDDATLLSRSMDLQKEGRE